MSKEISQEVAYELLEALKSLKKRLEFINSAEEKFYNKDNTLWVEQARQAIAKATQ